MKRASVLCLAVEGPVLVTAWAIRKTDEMLSQVVPGRRTLVPGPSIRL